MVGVIAFGRKIFYRAGAMTEGTLPVFHQMALCNRRDSDHAKSVDREGV